MTDRTPTGPASPEEPEARGLKGWFQRRIVALLSRPGRALPHLTEPGECHVVLQVTGATPIKVVKVICQATGRDLLSASDLVRDAPVIVASGISQASAGDVVDRLEKAGAKAVAGGLS